MSKEHLLNRASMPEEKDRVEKFLTIHGQEMSRTNYAICQADLLIKNDRQAKVTYGNSLIHECVTGQRRITEADVQRAEANRRFDNPCLKR